MRKRLPNQKWEHTRETEEPTRTGGSLGSSSATVTCPLSTYMSITDPHTTLRKIMRELTVFLKLVKLLLS